MSITYNTQVNTQALDTYLDPGIDSNIILNNLQYLKQDKNLVEVDCPDIYKYRPDRIAYQYYG
jgi:hypothetical protein